MTIRLIRKHPSLRILFALLLMTSCLLITGCQGCRKKSDEQVKKEKEQAEEDEKERDQPAFEIEAPIIYPGRYSGEIVKQNRTKRGHWVTTDFRIKSNKFPAQGDLATYSTAGVARASTVEDTDFIAVSQRPYSVAKGELKNLETSVYLPRRENAKTASVNYSMTRGAGGVKLVNEPRSFLLQKSFEYHLVVLTNRADSYSYLEHVDPIELPRLEDYQVAPPKFYNVLRTRPEEEPISLPRNALSWTTIAYLVWDNLDVDQLDEDQQTAMLDWLHFGGQLILSGPDCLNKLRGSFLSDYLPATITETRNFGAEDFAELNEHWAVKAENQEFRRELQVDDTAPIIGVDFELHPASKFVNDTGKIAVERAIGRGRIVATAFSLDSKPLLNWGSFESFINGALLRRPPRKFGTTHGSNFAFRWTTDKTSIFDPLIGSTLRYLSRDLVPDSRDSKGTPKDPNLSSEMINGYSVNPTFGSMPNDDGRFRTTDAPNGRIRNLDDHWHYGGYRHDEQSGTAGWNDSSGVSTAARETLKRAAGITPPSSTFVLRMLAIYLLVLVPVNWLIFRMMGRVEWAWIAAPLIAIAGALTVAKMASLDIGFVRSNSQVACLEVFADYPRAHVAQYSALYTSLSTGYDLELDNPTAQSLPLGDPTRNPNKQKTPTPVTLRKTINKRLEGFQVQSNSTGMLHTEMMVDLQGSFRLSQADDETRVENSTAVGLQEAAVLTRTESGELQGAWIGELQPSESSNPLKLTPIETTTSPWKSSKTLRSRGMAEQYWDSLKPFTEQVEIGDEATDSQIENLNQTQSEQDQKVAKIRVGKIKEVLPEIEADWDEFVRQLVARVEIDREGIDETLIDFPMFKQLLAQVEKVDGVNVSRIFHSVSKNLALAPGEVRLVAITNQQIGNNAFSPASTQTNEQTLVVVHLRRPDFLPARPDVNSTADYTTESDLTQAQRERQLEELVEQELESAEEERQRRLGIKKKETKLPDSDEETKEEDDKEKDDKEKDDKEKDDKEEDN